MSDERRLIEFERTAAGMQSFLVQQTQGSQDRSHQPLCDVPHTRT